MTRGTAWITSPRIDASGAGRNPLDFSRWLTITGQSYSNSLEYRAAVSSDDGVTWSRADTSYFKNAYWSK